jgi:hypothetical protein
MEPTDSWDAYAENSCKSIGNRAGAFVWILNALAAYYAQCDFILSLIVTIGKYLSGGAGLIVLFKGDNNPDINLAINIFVLTLGVISTAQLFINFNAKVGSDRWLSGKCGNLFLKINSELAKPIARRQAYTQFYQDLLTLENDYRTSLPTIPDAIMTKYTATMGSGALPYSQLFETIIGSGAPDATETTTLARNPPTEKQKYDLTKYMLDN